MPRRAAIAAALALGAVPAGAHPRIVFGGALGVPGWPPPAWPYPAAGPPAPGWPGDAGVPPPGWEPGRREWRRDLRGRRYPVYTPPHLR